MRNKVVIGFSLTRRRRVRPVANTSCAKESERQKKKKKSRDLVELRRPGFVEPGSKFNNAAALLEKWCREIRQSARTALWVTFHYTVKEMSLYFTHCVWSNKSNYGSCLRVWRCCEWWEKKMSFWAKVQILHQLLKMHVQLPVCCSCAPSHISSLILVDT